MKEFLKTLGWPLAFAAMLIAFGLYLNHISEKLDNIEPSIITVTDTIYDIKLDTLAVVRYDTLLYQFFDTLIYKVSDTVTVSVPVPISKYTFDTVISQGDSLETSIKGVLSGFGVSVDTLCLNTIISQQEANLGPSRGSIWSRLIPSVGVGYGTGGFGVFVGVGVALW